MLFDCPCRGHPIENDWVPFYIWWISFQHGLQLLLQLLWSVVWNYSSITKLEEIVDLFANVWTHKGHSWLSLEFTHWPLVNFNETIRQVILKQILVIDGWGISCEIALRWMSQNLTDDVYPDLCRPMASLGPNKLKLRSLISPSGTFYFHDDVIKLKHFPRYWPFMQGIHRSPVNSPHKGQWRGALMLTLICVWINGWINNGEAIGPIMTSQ